MPTSARYIELIAAEQDLAMGTIVQLASLQTKVAFDEDRAAIEHDFTPAGAQDECAHDRLRFFPEAGFRCADCLADVADWD